MGGFYLSARVVSNRISYEFKYKRASITQRAEGKGSNGQFQRRYVRNAESAYGLNIGYNFYGELISAGLTLENSNTLVKSKVGILSEVKDKPWDKPMVLNAFQLGGYLRFVLDGACSISNMPSVEFYYKWSPFLKSGYSLIGLNQYMNPNTWQNDRQDLYLNPQSAGFRLLWLFGKRDFKSID
jgi:hypothetical protein